MIDFCQIMADIEADPKAPVELTVREFLALKEHVQNCDNCNVRVERTLAKEPKSNKIEGFGVN